MTDTERLVEIKKAMRLAWHDVNRALLFHEDLARLRDDEVTAERWARAEAGWRKANERLEALIVLQTRLLKAMRKQRIDTEVPDAMDPDP